MPIQPSQVLALLQAKRSEFKNFDKEAFQVLKRYRGAMAIASELSTPALSQSLAQLLPEQRGAEPLEPVGLFPNWVIPSHLVWENREQSLEWVRDRLTGIPTFAVDGSQIYASKDLSIPIALIQVGWFENLHLPTGAYRKNAALDILTPVQLRNAGSTETAERLVHQRRFQIEIRRLIQYMQETSSQREGDNPAQAYYPGLVFYDGSLIATFAETFDPETRRFYINCLRQLLRTSLYTRVPLVAYIDTTYARDLTLTLQHLCNLPEAPNINDAQLLYPAMKWGDRTPFFRCRRPGILKEYQDQSQQIGFTYLKTHEGYPVRLEMPIWLYEAGILDRIIDWVRGEVIIGSGYPYAIETADQIAVLQGEDRYIFYRLLQEWSDQEDLKLRFSRKMVSKARRR